MLPASITFYLKEPLICWGSFLISHFSRNTANGAALPGTGNKQDLVPALQGWSQCQELGKRSIWCSRCALLCPGRARRARWKRTQAGKRRSQVSWGMLPRCLWPGQSPLPAGTRCSRASSPAPPSSPAGVEGPGTLPCPLEPKKEILWSHNNPQRKGELLGGRWELGLDFRNPFCQQTLGLSPGANAGSTSNNGFKTWLAKALMNDLCCSKKLSRR